MPSTMGITILARRHLILRRSPGVEKVKHWSSIITTSQAQVVYNLIGCANSTYGSGRSNRWAYSSVTGDPLHSRAFAHSRAPLLTQPCPHCSHSRATGEQWARLCVFTLQGCVQAARLCRGSPVSVRSRIWKQLVRRTSSPKNSLVLMLS